MIGWLRGKIVGWYADRLILEVGGVGYEVMVPASTREKISRSAGEIGLHIHTHVREDAIQLFGFKTTEEIELFRLLIHTRDIGPKLANQILSVLGPDEFVRAIASRDQATLRRVPGLGPKKVEQLVLELKDRVGNLGLGAAAEEGSGSLREDLLSALRNLGYKVEEVVPVVNDVLRTDPAPALETGLREVLKRLDRR